MRSLLGTIAMNAEMIERQVRTDAAHVTRFLAPIQRATAQMTRLVADLLEVASFDAGKFILLPGRHDAGYLVREVTDIFRTTSLAQDIAISACVPEGSLIGEFDRDRIVQVLTNLVANALKFTPRGGSVSIAVAPHGTALRFSVADTGPGIPPEKVEAVFERYAQVQPSGRGGLGLGLHIAQRVVTWVTQRVRGGVRGHGPSLAPKPPLTAAGAPPHRPDRCRRLPVGLRRTDCQSSACSLERRACPGAASTYSRWPWLPPRT